VKRHLGEDLGDLFCRFYGISPEGNFAAGRSIPFVSHAPQIFAQQEKMSQKELADALKDSREKLFQAREKRVHPLKDDKIITSWNGLMIAALAKGYQALQEATYARAAQKAADFILQSMRTTRGRLPRRYRHGHIAYPGFLDDYAHLIWGLIELYEATFQAKYLEEALLLNQAMSERFWDEGKGGFYFTAKDGEALIARPKESYDGAIPSGNSVAALNLLRLARMTGNMDLEEKAGQLLGVFSASITEHPMAHTHLLQGLDFMLGPTQEVVIVGAPHTELTQAMITLLHRAFLPRKVLLLHPGGEAGDLLSTLSPFVEKMKPIGGKATVYLCEKHACQTPLTDLASLKAALL